MPKFSKVNVVSVFPVSMVARPVVPWILFENGVCDVEGLLFTCVGGVFEFKYALCLKIICKPQDKLNSVGVKMGTVALSSSRCWMVLLMMTLLSGEAFTYWSMSSVVGFLILL